MLQIDDLRWPDLGPIFFHIDDGECLALTGRSGAGKTLLLRALVDFDPNQGRVNAAGRGRATLLVSQDAAQVARLAGRSLNMEQGRLIGGS